MAVRRFRASLATFALGAASVGVLLGGRPSLAQPPRCAGPVTRIMPLGDSITQGGQGHASWRYPLWFSLAPLQAVDFVGTRGTLFGGEGPTNPVAARYPHYFTTFDRAHEGHWGRRTDEVEPFVYAAARSASPDVVLVHLGTNDVGQRGAAGVRDAELNLARIIDDVRAARPAARFYVAKVVPIGPGNSYSVNAPAVSALNQALESLVAAKDTPASPVFLVDAHTGFDVGTQLQPDGVHPNVAGELHIAGAFRAALLANWSPPLPQRQPRPDVRDAGFEQAPLSDGQARSRPAVTPWRFGSSGQTDAGILDPSAGDYLGAFGAGTPQGAEGDQALYLADLGTGNDAIVAFQTLTTTFEPGHEYTLAVAVGNRLPGNPLGATFGGFRVELLAGNEVVASVVDTLVPAPGTFRSVVLRAQGAAAPPALHGLALTVRLGLTATAPLSVTDFDDVRLVVR